ncbi:short transient receptor potential channel 7-like [Corticium candelabrum]|uniref:short transient receptor potential channel 7-like n=1 Tax=Corticium candelabrum TaxID=121492 RepID=UPI002E263A81|nr:short transient receptor potential channel 7-like [Corticium candelabrum]
MTLSGIFCNLARFNPMKAVLYYNFRDEMEDIAVTMLDAATNHTQQPLIITDKLLATALDKNQKKVIGHTKMQDYLALQWCGSRSFSFQTLLYAIWLISVYCIKLTLAPFVIPIAAVLYGRDFRKLVWRRLFVCTPSIARYATTTLVYLAFVSVIMYDSVSTAGLRDPRHFLVSDYVMTVFLAGFLLNGVCKLTSSGPATYFCKVKNLMDISVIVLFAINYTIRFHNKIVYHDTDLRDTIDSISLSHRVASLAYALGSLLAVLRVLGYLQIIYSIGPILTSFRKITAATTSFIFILLVFLIAFAVALTNVYAANSYSLSLDIVHDCLHQSNTTKPFIQNALSPPAAITGCIQYAMELADPPLRPAVAADVIKSAVNLVWATFGLIETDDYKSYNKIETTIGQFLLAMWLVSAIIILTNMLVAMITNIFDKVQDNADLEWKFTQAEVIWETVTVPSVQPPFNIPYYVAMTLGYLITLCPLCHCTRKIHNIESEVSDDPLASSINSNLSLWEAYQSEIKKRKQSEPVTKKKLERLQDKLIQEIQSIKRESRAAYSRNTTSSDSGCSTDQLDSDVFTLSTGQDISHTVEHMQMYLEKLSEDINKVKMQLLMTEIRKTPVPV